MGQAVSGWNRSYIYRFVELKRKINISAFDFDLIDSGMSRTLAFSRADIKPPSMHRALNSSFIIYIAADEGTAAMGTAVFDGKDCPVNIE